MPQTPFKNYISAAGVIDIITIIFVLFFQRALPPEVPLFYGLPQGEGQLAKPIFLLIPALLSLLVVALNTFLIRLVKNDFLEKVLAIASLATAVFAGITTFKIIFLVGNI